MNAKDRAYLRELYAVLELPGWSASGSASASIDGLIGYAKDGTVAVEATRVALLSLMCHPGARDEHFPEVHHDEVLEALRWWRKRRDADGWTVAGARPYPNFAAVLAAMRTDDEEVPE